jgi:hypothetical protein
MCSLGNIDAEWARVLVQAAVTILGVYLAARLAFKNERTKAEAADKREREKAERTEFRTRAAAVNLATHTLQQMYSTLIRFKQDVIDPDRRNPGNWCAMRPSDMSSGPQLDFDYAALQFLFDSENPNVVAELAREARNFAYLRNIVAQRSQIHISELQPKVEKTGVPPPHAAAFVESAGGPRVAYTLKELTNGMIVYVDTGVSNIERLQKALRKAAKPMVGDWRLIRFIVDVVGLSAEEAKAKLED